MCIDVLNGMADTIVELERKLAEREWIPCSERLPKEKQEVYVTVYFTEGDTGRAYGYMDGFGKWHLYSAVEGTLNSGYEVIAWMLLPMPYREEREDYELATEQMEHDAMYEPTYNSEDGSM